ncbi:MAG TPA: type II secretion system F family protein [Acetobacteraceae bacterium]|nr:type II secretion system F family protein [Acetobacteraceae bacterium]
MNPANVLLAALASALVAGGAAILLLRRARQERLVHHRLRAISGDRRREPRAAPRSGSSFPLRVVAGIGTTIARSGLLSNATIGELEQALVAAGLQGRNGLGLFIGSKIMLLIWAPLGAWLVLRGLPVPAALARLLPLAAGAVGLLLPDTVVRRMRARYLDRVERGVPDALDMLVICTQAGLGLEAAMARVAEEIGRAHPELAAELAQTTSELRIAVDTPRALANLGHRTGLASLKRVTATLVQTLNFGTPLTAALRVLAAEMRQHMLTRFEERAARLPVMLTLPMILFIFPCLFIVIGGPAVIQLGRAFAR